MLLAVLLVFALLSAYPLYRMTAASRLLAKALTDDAHFKGLIAYTERLSRWAGLPTRGSYEDRKSALTKDPRFAPFAFMLDLLVTARFSGKPLTESEKADILAIVREARKQCLKGLSLTEKGKFLWKNCDSSLRIRNLKRQVTGDCQRVFAFSYEPVDRLLLVYSEMCCGSYIKRNMGEALYIWHPFHHFSLLTFERISMDILYIIWFDVLPILVFLGGGWFLAGKFKIEVKTYEIVITRVVLPCFVFSTCIRYRLPPLISSCFLRRFFRQRSFSCCPRFLPKGSPKSHPCGRPSAAWPPVRTSATLAASSPTSPFPTSPLPPPEKQRSFRKRSRSCLSS